MNRTRAIFVLIISGAACIILGAIAVQFIGSLSNGEVETAAVDSTRAPDATDIPADAVLVTLASSNTKENWLNQVVAQFNAENHRLSAGQTIVVEVSHVTSGGSMNAILDGSITPAAWSPGDASWVDQIDQTWQQRTNRPIHSQSCKPTIYAPLGFAMWRPMAETLGWPDTPVGWDTIVDLAADPDGWATYGRPEWGTFRFGHAHPGYANSGLLSMTGFVYGIVGGSDQLTGAQVYQAEDAMRTLEMNTSAYGRQSPALLDLMARQGPSYLHAAAVPEADAVRFNIERGDELQFPLAFIFPAEGTIWADHPYCVLDNAEWVTAEQAEGAGLFLDYLLAVEQQELAIDNFLRPLDTSIALHAPLDLENGTDPSVSPETIRPLPSPDADVSAAVIDLFLITKRKATIIIVLDVSGSMEGDKIKSATAATVEFLSRLDPNDQVALLTFSSEVVLLSEPERVGDVVESLSQRVSSLIADGNTSLYGAVCEATELTAAIQAADEEAGDSRLYGIVLLSDGEDTVGNPTGNQMFVHCLPANAEADGIKIYPIAFGEDAAEDVLAQIAAVTGGRMFTADPASISNVYISISAEQ
jgi:Ca-activated chloride channel family protein